MTYPTSRNFPRTLQQAFGPYTSSHIITEETPTPLHEKVLYGVALLALLVIAYAVWS